MADILTAESIEWARRRSSMKDELAKVVIDIAAICASHEALRARCEHLEQIAETERIVTDNRCEQVLRLTARCEQAERDKEALLNDLVEEHKRLLQAERERDALKKPAQQHCSSCVDPQCWGTRQPLQLTVDAALARIAALEAHIRECREQLLYELGTHDGPTGLIDRSLALVPDEAGAK